MQIVRKIRTLNVFNQTILKGTPLLQELRYQRNTVLKVQLLLILRRGLPHLCIFVDFNAWATPPYLILVV